MVVGVCYWAGNPRGGGRRRRGGVAHPHHDKRCDKDTYIDMMPRRPLILHIRHRLPDRNQECAEEDTVQHASLLLLCFSTIGFESRYGARSDHPAIGVAD